MKAHLWKVKIVYKRILESSQNRVLPLKYISRVNFPVERAVKNFENISKMPEKPCLAIYFWRVSTKVRSWFTLLWIELSSSAKINDDRLSSRDIWLCVRVAFFWLPSTKNWRFFKEFDLSVQSFGLAFLFFQIFLKGFLCLNRNSFTFFFCSRYIWNQWHHVFHYFWNKLVLLTISLMYMFLEQWYLGQWPSCNSVWMESFSLSSSYLKFLFLQEKLELSLALLEEQIPTANSWIFFFLTLVGWLSTKV